LEIGSMRHPGNVSWSSSLAARRCHLDGGERSERMPNGWAPVERSAEWYGPTAERDEPEPLSLLNKGFREGPPKAGKRPENRAV